MDMSLVGGASEEGEEACVGEVKGEVEVAGTAWKS